MARFKKSTHILLLEKKCHFACKLHMRYAEGIDVCLAGGSGSAVSKRLKKLCMGSKRANRKIDRHSST